MAIYHSSSVEKCSTSSARILKHKAALALTALLFTFLTGGWGASSAPPPANLGAVAPDCGRCGTLREENDALRIEESKMSVALDHQRAELKALPVENSSTRMKMTSGIFVLVAKIETAQNKRSAKEGEMARMNCFSCPLTKKSTVTQ